MATCMNRENNHASGSDWRLPYDSMDTIVPRREGRALLLGPWDWLEQLRSRFDLSIEILDKQRQYVLAPAPAHVRAPDTRAAITTPDDERLREAAAAVFRTGKARSFAAGGLHLRVFPLFAGHQVPRSVVGLLLLGTEAPAASATRPDPPGELDRRLDAAGQWLTAAVEATIDATALRSDETRAAERFGTIIDLVEAFGRMNDDRQLIDLTVEALAMWYDADVRGYRQDVSGQFVLEAWLPGLDVSQTVRSLPGNAVWDHHEVFRLDSPSDVADLGWDPQLGDTLFVPLAVEDSTEWVLTVSGVTEPSIEATLTLLRRVVSLLLTKLDRDAIGRVARMTAGRLALCDAPFDEVVRMGLETLAGSIGASGSQIAIYRQGQDAPATSIQWGTIQRDPGLVEVGHDRATPHGIASSAVAGPGVTAVLWCEKRIETFSAADARIAHSVATTFANWFCGTIIKRGDHAGEPAPRPSSDLMERMRESVDRRGRIVFAGSLAIVAPESDLPSAVELDELERVVRRGLRSSDTIGVLSDRAVGVLLEGIDDAAGQLIVDRILRVAQKYGVRSLRIGITTFQASSDTVDAILEQTFSNIRRGGAKA
jgi:hypothetical protein